jgi:hypothetical protein
LRYKEHELHGSLWSNFNLVFKEGIFFIENAMVTSVFQVLLEEQGRSCPAQCVLFGHHSEICDAPITILMKSYTQMNSPTPLNITHFQLADHGRKTLCHKQNNNICKVSLGIRCKTCQNQSGLLDLKFHYL